MSLILFGFYPTLHLHFCSVFIVLRGFPGPLLVHFSFSGFTSAMGALAALGLSPPHLAALFGA